MMSLLIRKRRNRVVALAAHIDQERLMLRQITQAAHARLQTHLRDEWALVGCFAAGFLTGRFGSRLVRPFRAIPLWAIARKLRPYIHLPF